MSERQPLFSLRNPWFNASIGITAAIAVLAAFFGLVWLPLAQPNLRLSGVWDAICSAAGVPRASRQITVNEPDFKTSGVVVIPDMLVHPRSGVDRTRRDARATLCDLPRATRRQRRQFAKSRRPIRRRDLQGAE